MNILGFIETSLVDWDGKITAVVFLGGCNFRCRFCQNHPLFSETARPAPLGWQSVKEKLLAKKAWLDGVVVSGGEPTIDPGLEQLLAEIHGMGFPVKLDTNGSRPGVLGRLFERTLVDYVAMDIKSAFDERYAAAAGTEVSLPDILESIRLIEASGVDYEFRTTLVPGVVGKREVEEIVRSIRGARSYVLQQFVPDHACDEDLRGRRPYSRLVVKDIIDTVHPVLGRTGLRGKFE